MKLNSLLFCLLGAGLAAAGSHPAAGADEKLMIALMPKSKGNAYFLSCKVGADRAAKELGVDLLFDGPEDSNAAKQNEIVENWITLGVDAIAVAAENKEGISTALRKAQKQGIKVITYDADALSDARGGAPVPFDGRFCDPHRDADRRQPAGLAGPDRGAARGKIPAYEDCGGAPLR
jgi:ABC-type sugar transport system substrate-binding protein